MWRSDFSLTHVITVPNNMGQGIKQSLPLLLAALLCCLMSGLSYADDVSCYNYQDDHPNTGINVKPWISYRAIGEDKFIQLAVDGQATRLSATHYDFKLCILNTSSETIELQLSLDPPILNQLEFYPASSQVEIIKTGFTLPFDSRRNGYRQFSFAIILAPHAEETYHLAIKHPNLPTTGLNVELWEKSDFETHAARDTALKLIHFGIFIALFFYHLALYVMNREKTLLFFLLCSAGGFLIFYGVNGFLFQQFLGDYPQWNVVPLKIIGGITTIFVVLYITHFLRLPETMPAVNKRINGTLILSLVLLCVLWPFGRWYLTFVIVGGMFIMPLFVFTMSFYAYLKQNRNSIYVFIATGVPCTIYLLFALGINRFGLGLELALTSSMLMFSFAMGHQFTQTKREKELAQTRALEQFAENALLKDLHNAELENRIKARTAEIEEKSHTLERQANQLRAVDKMKSDFFSNISHEFRTPLTLIQGPLQQFVADQSGQLSANNRAKAEIALRNTSQLSKLIDQLLELAKIEGKRQLIRVSEMDINQFAREQVAQFSSLGDSRHIKLKTQLADTPTPLYFDYTMMQKIINNLLSNAIKFTPKGGEISLIIRDSGADQESSGADAYIELIVTDSGRGISDRDIPHVFDRFYQGEGQLNEAGTGIGLALVNELVTLHGGSIQLRSELDKGSVFTLWFPKGCDHFRQEEFSSSAINQDSASPESSDPVQFEPSAKNSATTKTHKILIVDDNADMRSYLAHCLIDSYELVYAENGIEGLVLATNEKPDIIVSDVMMPEMDGISFLKAIRIQPDIQHIPVILLSALASSTDKFLGLRAQADDYLIKPFNTDELIIRIDNLIERNQRLSPIIVDTNLPAQKNASNTQSGDFISKLQNEIERHIMDPEFDVDTLASIMSMSKATLYRHVKSAVSRSPGVLIREHRLLRARQIFHSGDTHYRTVEQVAAAVGIKKNSYFIRIYRNIFGDEPGFRKTPP